MPDGRQDGGEMPVQVPAFRRSVARRMEDYRRRMADRIQTERLRHGERPIDIAYRLGIDKRTYERWEAGEVTPQGPNLRRLAEHWNVEVKDLRPDLAAEENQLNRIEGKLDRLLDILTATAGAPPDLAAQDAEADRLAAEDQAAEGDQAATREQA